MQCPKCHVSMQPIPMGPAAVDECAQCGGLWFDHGELDQVIGTTDPDLRWLDIDFWKDASDFTVSPDAMGCPKCSRYYLTRLEDRATQTSAALCGNCHGIWLDAGQLRGIIRAVARCANQMDSADYLKESLHQVGEMFGAAGEKPVSFSHWRDLKTLLQMLKYRIYSEHPKLVSMLVGAQKSLPL